MTSTMILSLQFRRCMVSTRAMKSPFLMSSSLIPTGTSLILKIAVKSSLNYIEIQLADMQNGKVWVLTMGNKIIIKANIEEPSERVREVD